MGWLGPEARAAAAELDGEGVDTAVVVVTSADRLYRGWQSTVRSAAVAATTAVRPCHLQQLLGRRRAPVVSAHGASGHALPWIGSAVGVRQIPLGVERFGESGTIADLYDLPGIRAAPMVNAPLLAVRRGSS